MIGVSTMKDSWFDMMTGFFILLIPVIGMFEIDKFYKCELILVVGVIVAFCVVRIFNRPL